MTIDGLSSAFTARFRVFLVIGLKAMGLLRKREESVGLLSGLRPWKVGAENRADAIFELCGGWGFGNCC